MENYNLQKNQLSFFRGYGILKESGEGLYSTGQVTPTGDLAFKKVLSSEGNEDILRGLINDFFGIMPEEIILQNPYSIKAYKEMIEDKEASVLRQTLPDVSASLVLADFTVEMQLYKTSSFDKRALHYPFFRYCENYNKQGHMQIGSNGKPDRYSSLKPVYALNILGYNHFQDDDALRIFEMHDRKRNKSMNIELIKVGFFELKKPNIETVNQRHWRNYYVTGKVPEVAPEYIRKAAKIIEYSNLSKEEQTMITEAEKAEATYDAQLVYSYYEGIAEGEARGIAEGEARGIAEVARNFLKKGLLPEVIAEGTGLPLDVVLDLKNQLRK